MPVDLSDFIPSLQRELNAPGDDNFPKATDDEWLGNLSDGFWEARLDGFIPTYTCDENGIITPLRPTDPDMTRDLVQLVVLYASFRILRNMLRNLRTQFAATAGPVKFEYQQSANLIVALMKDLTDRRNILLIRLSDLGVVNDQIIDAVMARDLSIRDELTWFVGADSGYGPTF